MALPLPTTPQPPVVTEAEPNWDDGWTWVPNFGWVKRQPVTQCQ